MGVPIRVPMGRESIWIPVFDAPIRSSGFSIVKEIRKEIMQNMSFFAVQVHFLADHPTISFILSKMSFLFSRARHVIIP